MISSWNHWVDDCTWSPTGDHISLYWTSNNDHKLEFWACLDDHIDMKTNRRGIATQRQLLDQRLESWAQVRDTPPSGWIKAVRGALKSPNERALATTEERQAALDHELTQRMFFEKHLDGNGALDTWKIAGFLLAKLDAISGRTSEEG